VTLQLTRKVVLVDRSGTVLRTFDQCQGEPFRGPGRLAMDAGGGLYFTDSGSPADDWVSGAPTGSVIYVPTGGEPVRVATGLSYPDGLAISPDGKFLVVAEHRQNRLMIYRIIDGSLVDGKPFATLTEVPEVTPDFHYELGPAGLGCEPEGYFWVADYASGRIVRIGADGQVLGSGDIPKGSRPCGLCIGPKGDEAYYTEIDSGSIWLVRVKHAPQPGQREKKSTTLTTPQQRPHAKKLPTHNSPIQRLGP
jgi:gluconolactonase